MFVCVVGGVGDAVVVGACAAVGCVVVGVGDVLVDAVC